MKKVVCILVIFALLGCKKKERTHREYYNNLYPTETKVDSAVPDTIVQSESTATPYSSVGTYHSSGDDHYGTPPDDGMFGFDPLDDYDDIYSDDHFQQDAYPDDDY